WSMLRRVQLARLKDIGSWRRLVEVARVSDPDPWRNGLRTIFDRPLPEALAILKKQAADVKGLQRQPPPSLVLLARFLRSAGQEKQSAEILRLAWLRFPADFWVNHQLGDSSWANNDFARLEEAVRFLTAAVVARPRSAAAHSSLGSALARQGKRAEAI